MIHKHNEQSSANFLQRLFWGRNIRAFLFSTQLKLTEQAIKNLSPVSHVYMYTAKSKTLQVYLRLMFSHPSFAHLRFFPVRKDMNELSEQTNVQFL